MPVRTDEDMAGEESSTHMTNGRTAPASSGDTGGSGHRKSKVSW